MKCTRETFLEAWNSCNSIDEVVLKTGLSYSQVYMNRRKYGLSVANLKAKREDIEAYRNWFFEYAFKTITEISDKHSIHREKVKNALITASRSLDWVKLYGLPIPSNFTEIKLGSLLIQVGPTNKKYTQNSERTSKELNLPIEKVRKYLARLHDMHATDIIPEPQEPPEPETTESKRRVLQALEAIDEERRKRGEYIRAQEAKGIILKEGVE